MKLEHGNTAAINLVYETGGTGLTFQAGIDTGTSFDTSAATKDETAKTITYTIDPSFLTSDGFGTYLLTFTLTPTSGAAGTKEVVVFYEEPITGFAVSKWKMVLLDFNDFIYDVKDNISTLTLIEYVIRNIYV